MPELGTSGTVGAAGGQSPAATQQLQTRFWKPRSDSKKPSASILNTLVAQYIQFLG
jgi:hypothetical protein